MREAEEMSRWRDQHTSEPPDGRTSSADPTLCGAAFRGDDATVAALLEDNVDVDPRMPGGQTPLHLAARGGHLKVARLLVEYGADLNARDGNGETPLDSAIQHNHPRVADFLIGEGEDINRS